MQAPEPVPEADPGLDLWLSSSLGAVGESGSPLGGTIVYAVPDFEPAVGGTTRQAGLQARALLRRGYDVVVVTRRFDSAWPRHEVLDGLPVFRIGPPGRDRRRAAWSAHAELAWWLARRRRAVSVVQTVMWADAALSAAFAGLASRTAVLWAIDGDPVNVLHPGRSLPRRIQGRLRHAVLSGCEHVALTRAIQDELRGAGIERASTIIPVPVDCRHFRPPSAEERRAARRKLDLPQGAFVVVYLGHLQERKGVERLVAAFSELVGRHADARLVLVGGSRGAADDTEPKLKAQVRQAALEAEVLFAGPVPDPREHLWAADVLALPSFREGMPNSLLEAMACGLPVVAPPSAAPAELIDAEIGFFPPSNEPRELLAMLERLAADDALRAAMGEAARLRAMEYDIERVALEYETLYRSLAPSR